MQVAAALKLLEQYLAEFTPSWKLPYGDDEDFELFYGDDGDFELWCYKVADVLKAAFGDESDEYGRFAVALSSTSKETALKSILQKHKALSGLQGQMSTVSEAVYPAGSQYDAYKAIKGLVGAAVRQLVIADPYVDPTLVELLEVVPVGVSIRVLTRDMKGDFRLAASKFGQQRGNFEVRREPGDLHDRYLIIDDEAYSLGASIKDAGTKMFGINRQEQPQVKQIVITLIKDLWEKSAKVV